MDNYMPSNGKLKNNFESISIIIPVFNEQEHIKKCLDRILEIKKTSMYAGSVQIIVVDNGSTDNTKKILLEYRSKILIINEPRKGTGFARQRGLECATGNYIACIDADCLPSENWIKTAMKIFKDEKVNSIAGLCVYSNDYKFAWIPTSAQVLFFPLIHLISRTLGMGGMMLHGNSWFRKDALGAIGGFDITHEFWGDDARTAQQISKLNGKMKYSIDLKVITSSRRYANDGLGATLFAYIISWFQVAVLKKVPK